MEHIDNEEKILIESPSDIDLNSLQSYCANIKLLQSSAKEFTK